jgi:hypothetical protein
VKNELSTNNENDPIDDRPTLITSPEEPAFLMFRFYGAKPELWEKKWILGDAELIK